MSNDDYIKLVSFSEEIWKDVPNFENLYKVSSFGRILSCSKQIKSNFKNFDYRTTPPKILSPSKSDNGYLKICLRKNKKLYYFSVHRLVALTFIPNPNNKPTIDHIDRNRSNNKVDNLRWCTLSENMHNPLTIQHCRNFAKTINRSYRNHPVVSIKDRKPLKFYKSIEEAVLDGYKSSLISSACSGRLKTHKGLQWMYLEDYENNELSKRC